MPGEHSEWTILTGFIPITLAAAIVEIVVDPELVDLLVGDLGRGLGFAVPFVQELLMMSTLEVSYIVLCWALLGYEAELEKFRRVKDRLAAVRARLCNSPRRR